MESEDLGHSSTAKNALCEGGEWEGYTWVELYSLSLDLPALEDGNDNYRKHVNISVCRHFLCFLLAIFYVWVTLHRKPMK